jgi:hypothetical protein
MSIYIMTVGDLAKKRGEPVGEFVKKVQSLGFDAGSHAKRLTQEDLNSLIPLLEGTSGVEIKTQESKELTPTMQNPNVLLINLPNGKKSVALVDATINDLGKIDVRIISHSTEDSLGEALLEFRKQMGIHMGVN